MRQNDIIGLLSSFEKCRIYCINYSLMGTYSFLVHSNIEHSGRLIIHAFYTRYYLSSRPRTARSFSPSSKLTCSR